MPECIEIYNIFEGTYTFKIFSKLKWAAFGETILYCLGALSKCTIYNHVN